MLTSLGSTPPSSQCRPAARMCTFATPPPAAAEEEDHACLAIHAADNFRLLHIWTQGQCLEKRCCKSLDTSISKLLHAYHMRTKLILRDTSASIRYAYCVPAAYRLRTGCVPAAYRLRTSCVPAAYRLRTSCVSGAYLLRTVCVPDAYHVRTICVSYAYHMRIK